MLKKLLSLLLALSLIACAACIKTGNAATPSPAHSGVPADSDAPASADASAMPTAMPTSTPTVIKSDADEAFEALSSELFISAATSSGFVYHQFIKDPAVFGIDESEVERGWGSISLESHNADHAENDDVLARLADIDRNKLTPVNANAYDTLSESVRLANLMKDYYYYSEPLETLNGEHTMLPLTMTMYDINDKSDLDGYMYLLEDMPRYLGEIEAFEKEKAERGLFMTENALDTVLGSIAKFANSGEDCFLIDYIDKVLSEGVEGVGDAEARAYSERNRNCVLNSIIPAYNKLKSTLEGLRGKCGKFVGAFERGDEARDYFIASIKNSSACEMEPFEMAELLNDTAAKLLSKFIEIIGRDRTAIGGLTKSITGGDTDTDIKYLLELIQNIYPGIPEQRIDYVIVPDAVAEDFSPAAYLISAFDDPTRNIVIKNPTADNSTMLFTMAHECFPGHLYQTQYFRNGSFPLVQQIACPSGYSEGWAVFSELMVASRAERYGVNACLLNQYNSLISGIIIPTYISLRVNCDGWDKEQIGEYLDTFGLNNDAYIEIIYEYAVNMPDYFFSYGMGFANTYRIYHHVEPVTDAELKAFFTDYLSVGPCCYDVLFEHFGMES